MCLLRVGKLKITSRTYGNELRNLSDKAHVLYYSLSSVPERSRRIGKGWGKVFIFLLILFSFQGKSQYYDAGQDPASVKWKQINTEHYQLIFPSEFDDNAIHLANYLEKVYDYNTQTLKVKPKKLSIVLHNRTVFSNAFVTWAPKRSEYYTCPPQDMYAQPWLDQLATHEYRHYVQVSKLLHGFTWVLNLPFGQTGPGAVAGVYLPRWFLEGDAVATETLLSHAGRGRVPFFDIDLRAQLNSTGIYNYNKALYGSYKDHVPDPYTLGYNLVAVSRLKYGAKLWDGTLNYIARNSFLGIPFSLGIHKETGLSKNVLYKETLHTLDSLWKDKFKNNDVVTAKQINKRTTNDYTNFRFPNYVNDSEFIALRNGIDYIPAFVFINKKGEVLKAFSQGNDFMQSLSYGNGMIAWAETYNDPRWDHRSYAVIKTLDLQTKKVHTLTKHTRYFAPAISNDGKRIATVEVSEVNKYALVILDAQTGKLLNKIPSIDDAFLATSSWSRDDHSIVMIAVNKKGKTLAEYNDNTNTIHFLLPFDYTEISEPCYYKNYIIFNGAYTGIDNIFALNLVTNKIYRVTSTQFGAADPCISINDKQLAFANYSAKGYDVNVMDIDTSQWKLLKDCKDLSLHLPEKLLGQEKGVLSLQDSTIKRYEIKNYSKLTHLFNLHSWAPLSIDANNQSAAQGVSFMSQNLLSTMFTTAGWEYVPTENTGKYYLNFTYKGWYPVIDLKTDFRTRYSHVNYINKGGQIIFIEPFTYNQTKLDLDVRVPQNYTRCKYFYGYQPELHTVLTNISTSTDTSGAFHIGNINYLNYRLYLYRLLRTSNRDLYPAWGQTLDFNYVHSPLGLVNYGDIISAETYLYFPSIIKHQGFILYGGYQQRKTVDYYNSFNDIINYPLGYLAVPSDKFSSVSVNYYFPLICPDISISSLIYLKRIDMKLFYNYAVAKYNNQDIMMLSSENYYRSDKMKSLGAEINSDIHILRFLAPINLGYRFIYHPDQKQLSHEIMFNIDFNSLSPFRYRNVLKMQR